MKKFLFAFFFLGLIFLGCKKQETGCTPIKPEVEEPQILAYAAKDSIHAVKHSSGIYYEIINPGTGAIPTPTSDVSVTYTGKFLNETKFDEKTNPVSLNLSRVIEGWQIGIPLVKEGGRIKLIIPSSLAYGCNPVKDDYGTVVIPGNSVLFFDVTVSKVQ